jgi:hypothetical protein
MASSALQTPADAWNRTSDSSISEQARGGRRDHNDLHTWLNPRMELPQPDERPPSVISRATSVLSFDALADDDVRT